MNNIQSVANAMSRANLLYTWFTPSARQTILAEWQKLASPTSTISQFTANRPTCESGQLVGLGLGLIMTSASYPTPLPPEPEARLPILAAYTTMQGMAALGTLYNARVAAQTRCAWLMDYVPRTITPREGLALGAYLIFEALNNPRKAHAITTIIAMAMIMGATAQEIIDNLINALQPPQNYADAHNHTITIIGDPKDPTIILRDEPPKSPTISPN